MQGNVNITLKNPDGSIAARHGGPNLITNAIQQALQPPHTWFASRAAYPAAYYFADVMPIHEKWFGGILLWASQIPENANIIIPPDPADQTGHAGSEYVGISSQRGTLNAVESGAVEGGVKFVWDFNSNQANGIISCLTATCQAGGDAGWKPDPNDLQALPFLKGAGAFSPGSLGTHPFNVMSETLFGSNSQYTTEEVSDGWRAIGCRSVSEIVFARRLGKSITLNVCNLAGNTIGLLTPSFGSSGGSVANCHTIQVALDAAPPFPTFWRVVGSEAIIPIWVSATQLHLCRIDLDTGILSQVTVTVPSGGSFGSASSFFSCAITNNYLYVRATPADAYGWGKTAWKIALADPSSIQEVPMSLYATSNVCKSECSYLALPDDVVLAWRSSPYLSQASNPIDVKVWSENGSECLPHMMQDVAWHGFTHGSMLPYMYGTAFFGSSSTFSRRVWVPPYVYRILPALSSIYNLPSPIVKSPGQTMKIEYTFLEGEEGA